MVIATNYKDRNMVYAMVQKNNTYFDFIKR